MSHTQSNISWIAWSRGGCSYSSSGGCCGGRLLHHGLTHYKHAAGIKSCLTTCFIGWPSSNSCTAKEIPRTVSYAQRNCVMMFKNYTKVSLPLFLAGLPAKDLKFFVVIPIALQSSGMESQSSRSQDSVSSGSPIHGFMTNPNLALLNWHSLFLFRTASLPQV